MVLPTRLLPVSVTDSSSFPLPLPFFSLGASVEDRNLRLLSQHPCFAYWLQDRPENRPEYTDGAVPPEASTYLL